MNPHTEAKSTRVNPSAPSPSHKALELTAGGKQASIVLDDQTYTLRITRAGKLILTK